MESIYKKIIQTPIKAAVVWETECLIKSEGNALIGNGVEKLA
jgi:hypothetical protein